MELFYLFLLSKIKMYEDSKKPDSRRDAQIINSR